MASTPRKPAKKSTAKATAPAKKSTPKAAAPAKKTTTAKPAAPARKTSTGRAARRTAPTHEAIAIRAYELSLAAGDGDRVAHWLQAEHELIAS
jgi:hypothetical protein